MENNKKDNKLETISNLFEGKEIRSVWDADKEEYYFSVVDVISALTDSNVPKRYWTDLKRNLIKEGSELYENIVQLKMKSQKDGKNYLTDTLDTKGIFRLIESVPSSKAEPFKLWLAQMGKDRIDEIFDPEIAINRAIDYYRGRGYPDKWIEARLKGILDRKKLTDVWKENGIKQNYEYAILTNEIYQSWSGMKASEYKDYKNIRKESLRDNMTDIEVALTDLGEIATRELAKEHKPYGLKENRKIAKMGGHAAKVARDDIEKNLGKSIISKTNALNYEYLDTNKKEQLEEKSNMNVVIRKKRRTDCKAIAHIVTLAWQQTYRGIVNDKFLDDLPNTEEKRMQKALKNFDKDNNNEYVLEVDGNIVGFINIGITDDNEFENCGEIFAIYIINNYKGYGFGKRLFNKGIEELKNLNCSKMIIGCLDGNSTNEFYKHLGGKMIKTRLFTLPNQELIENVYYYEKI